jgi:hypothetical protein
VRGFGERLRRVLVVVALVSGSALVPVLATVSTAGPAFAVECSADNVNFCATLSANASAAKVGTAILIHLESGLGNNQCFELKDDPAVSQLGVGDTPSHTTTPEVGNLTWKVIGPATPQTVTYFVLYRGAQPSANNCPGPSDPHLFIQQTVQVTWVAIGPEQNSTVVASPSTVIADGQSGATVTVVLTDAVGNSISGQGVRLTGIPVEQLGRSVVSGPGGQAVFTVTNATAEVLSVGAQRFDGTFWWDLDAHARVEFVPAAQAERALSTVTASLSRVPADGLSTSTVIVTLKDGSGPLAGRPVQLTAMPAGAHMTPQANHTNSSGQIGFTVSHSSFANVTFSAKDTASNLLVGQVVVRFGNPPVLEQGLSVLSLTPSQDVVTSATLPNDGTTAAAVYVQLRCSDVAESGCNAAGTSMYVPDMSGPTGTIAGGTVALIPTGPNNAKVSQILNPTNFNGEARFQVTNTVPETVTYNAFDVTNNVMLASVDDSTSPPQVTPLKITLTFVGPGTPSVTTSTATASPTSVAADGVTASTITVTLRDANRLVVPGRKVTLNPSSGSATFAPAEAMTNGDGVARFSTVDTRSETVSYMVKDVSDNLVLTSFPEVTFTAGAASSTGSTVSASPSTVAADGLSTATVTVTIADANGGPIAGKSVSLAQGGGHSTISAPSGPTGANGVTTFTVRNNTPEAVTYTATDVSDGFQLAQTATVTFTGRPTAANSTVTASPTSVAADSIATSTVTVTLKDQNNKPVAAKLVALKPAGQSKITPVSPGSDTTNPSGEATFSVSDGTAQTVTYAARDVTDNLDLTATATVSFTGPPSGSASKVVADMTSVLADGVHSSTITVTLLDGVSQPIMGHTIKLSANSGTHSAIALAAPGSNVTDAAGVARFSVTDTTGETVTYSATDTSVFPNQGLFATAQVVFAPTPAIQSISPDYGTPSGGTKVTITGVRLANATGVRFGDRAATTFSVNKKNGSITATSPAGSGVVEVTVVTPTGTTPVVPAGRFRYSPEVKSVSPTGGKSSGGTKVTITGTNLATATSVSFGSAVVDRSKFSRVNDTTVVLVAPPGSPGTVEVKVTTPGGTSAPVPFTYS